MSEYLFLLPYLGQRDNFFGLVEAQPFLRIREEMPHVGRHVGLQRLRLVRSQRHVGAAHGSAHDARVESRIGSIPLT